MEELIPRKEPVEKVIVFGPRNGKHLKQLYPELAKNPKYKDLSNDDLLFTWYFACESSPIDMDLPDALKVKIALAESNYKDPVKKKKYTELEFTETMKTAIDEMKKYKPKARELALKIAQNQLNAIYMNSQVTPDDFLEYDKEGKPTGAKNFTAIAQFTTAAKNSSEVVPILLKQIEEGFGVTDKKGEDIEGEKTINKFHQRDQ